MNTIDRETMLMLFSPETLEKDPKAYLENLNLCYREKKGILNYLNNTNHYRTWYSSLPQSLYYLVGNFEQEPEEDDFYGRYTTINEDLGIEIMIAMIDCGANLTVPNYYDEDIYMTIQQEESGVNSLTKRINNKNFIDCLKDYAKGIEWLN